MRETQSTSWLRFAKIAFMRTALLRLHHSVESGECKPRREKSVEITREGIEKTCDSPRAVWRAEPERTENGSVANRTEVFDNEEVEGC